MFQENTEIDGVILAKYSRNLISTDPLLENIPMTKKLHSGGVIYKSENKELNVPLERMSQVIEIPTSDVYSFNLESICYKINDAAMDLNQQMQKNVLQTLSQVTEFTGNVIYRKGKSFSPEMALEMLEKIHISFDGENKPVLPSTIGLGMDKELLKTIAEDDKYKKRFEEIMTKKREAYYAEKGSRRLSRID